MALHVVHATGHWQYDANAPPGSTIYAITGMLSVLLLANGAPATPPTRLMRQHTAVSGCRICVQLFLLPKIL